jgi:hypothetical protein
MNGWELFFTTIQTLARFVGVDFEVRWKDLNYCEQQAWIEAATPSSSGGRRHRVRLPSSI